jgi:CelD/BcsL family acetyltransferase involved in cellulose biosynthesis
MTIAACAFEMADGALALLPLISQRRLGGLMYAYESSSPGTYGGLIAERPLTASEVESIFKSLPSRPLAKLQINGNPFAPGRLPAGAAGPFTQAVDISGGFDAVSASWSKNTRKLMRRAENRGVQVSVAETEEEYRAYYAVYEEALRRWGHAALYREPLESFLNLRRIAGDSVRLWLARVDGKIIGGTFNLYHNRHVTCCHGTTLTDYGDHKPANFVHQEAIRDACNRGYAWYDLGNSSNLQGVIDFKESFSPQRLPFERATLRESFVYATAARARALMPR